MVNDQLLQTQEELQKKDAILQSLIASHKDLGAQIAAAKRKRDILSLGERKELTSAAQDSYQVQLFRETHGRLRQDLDCANSLHESLLQALEAMCLSNDNKRLQLSASDKPSSSELEVFSYLSLSLRC